MRACAHDRPSCSAAPLLPLSFPPSHQASSGARTQSLAFGSAPWARRSSITATRPFFAAKWKAVLPPHCEGARNGRTIEHETCARSSGGGEVEINDYILRACWSRKGRVGVGVVSDLALQADEGPVISKEPEGLRLVPTLQRRDKGGQFLGAIWHVLTTEATTTTTKVRLLARTAVGVDCRMVHTGGE